MPSVLYLIITTGKHNFIHLPIFGERKGLYEVNVDGKKRMDTIYHTLPEFSLINQDSSLVTLKTFEGKVFVADFFFTTCRTICPKMSTSLKYVQDRFKDVNAVAYISHTVNPDYDSVPVMANYASQVHANTANWYFVTGNKKQIYDLAIEGYLLPVAEDPRADGGFLHSEQFVLIDKEKRIRGFYDGTQMAEMKRLIEDINVLLAEYQLAKKHKK